MKMNSSMNRYCPKCRAYREHTVSVYKKGKDRSLAEGARRMVKRTRGYGSFPKAIQKRFSKTTKKTSFKYKCKQCGHVLQTRGIRLKKVDFEH